jgi:hypothetical protein
LLLPFFALPIACSQPVDESLGSPDPVATARGAADGLPSCSGTRLTVTIAADTGLRLDVPGNNYGTERSLHIGKPLTGDRQMMMLFDVSAVPTGALVQWARVTVHGGSASAGIIDVYPVTAPWAEYTVTWNNFGSGIAAAPLSSFTSAAYNSASITTVFDFLPEAQRWVSGTMPNRGVVLKNRSSAASAVAIFKSRESPDGPAKLDLCYEAPHRSLCAGVICAPLDQCHGAGICDPASGQCSSPLKANGAACDDHNTCTTADTCQGGICTGGAPFSCTAAHGSAACSGGSCEITGCVGSYRDCDGDPATGCEVDTSTNVSQCGACHLPCPSAPNTVSSCSGGACGSACAAGFADCDGNAANGCETTLDSSGTCGGTLCDAAHGNCDGNPQNGCETALDTAQNCGGCGVSCAAAHGTPACDHGACAVAACDPGWANCDCSLADGCETDTRVDAQNCGGCGVVCAAGASCVQGVCQ